jgi:hypothetical protein
MLALIFGCAVAHEKLNLTVSHWRDIVSCVKRKCELVDLLALLLLFVFNEARIILHHTDSRGIILGLWITLDVFQGQTTESTIYGGLRQMTHASNRKVWYLA